tara:strand:- start:671 stop:1717 length:1047 start_codon:yes stop_codon:yes gene_type:complete
VSFFPQLVAGPIERASNLIPQINKLSWIKKDVIEVALFQILWGLFLKIVVGDNIAVVVDELYSNVEHLNGMRLLLPSFLFSFQIYSDFAGYSLIAIGISKFFGVKLMDNFRTPYFSKSVTEFWSRWHISLSSWFKDYLYIPLGGNKVSIPRTYINILIVFLISGFWHGANWTFVFWGGFHGLILVIERLIRFNKITSKNYFLKFFRYAITFILVWIGWIFFRANSIHEAFNVLEKIPQGLITDVKDCLWLIKAWVMGQNDVGIHFFARWIERELNPNAIPNSEFIFVSIFLGLLLMLVFECFSRKKSIEILFQSFSFSGKLTVFTIVILMIAFFGQYQSDNQFIYFQF